MAVAAYSPIRLSPAGHSDGSVVSRHKTAAEKIYPIIIRRKADILMQPGSVFGRNDAHNSAVLIDTLLPIGISYTKITLRTSTKKVPLGGIYDAIDRE
jgi:hypothetical protein